MEKENENILLKSRSSQACIRDGYRFFTANFRRIFRITWPVAVGYAILSAAASALPVLISPSLLLPGAILATIAVILLLVTADWLLHKRQVMQQFGKLPFSAWFRHLGMVLLITIVCLFVVSVMALFTSLPTLIMMAANWESQIGMLNGDPSGMPDYVKWMTIIVFLIAGFIQAYVWMTVLGPAYMMRGSIAQQEIERQEFNTKNHEEKAIIHRP